jgi:SAM-dependent methyltransferase
MKIIKTLAELDEKIKECDRAGAVSDDLLRKVFGTFRMDTPDGFPTDPFSLEYGEFQMQLYRQIAGKDYSTSNEATIFDVPSAVRRPFPYATASCVTTGEQLMAIGFMMRNMDLPPRCRVLEMGAGWGNTTLLLAELGHSVTALDIEPRFCELIRQRAAQRDLAIDVINADFSWVESVAISFDAVVFFEAFHHAADHLRLLDTLRQAVAPNGRIYFGAEPIQPDFPYPWGLRLDGQSLWSIRKQGWLELGFQDGYFAQALRRNGWFARKYAAADPGWLNVWEASRRDTTVFRFAADNPVLRTEVGVRRDGAIVLRGAGAGAALFGPYISLPADQYVARVCFRVGAERRGRARMDVATDTGARILAHRSIEPSELSDACPVADLQFHCVDQMEQLEVRLICERGYTEEIEALEIRPAI